MRCDGPPSTRDWLETDERGNTGTTYLRTRGTPWRELYHTHKITSKGSTATGSGSRRNSWQVATQDGGEVFSPAVHRTATPIGWPPSSACGAGGDLFFFVRLQGVGENTSPPFRATSG